MDEGKSKSESAKVVGVALGVACGVPLGQLWVAVLGSSQLGSHRVSHKMVCTRLKKDEESDDIGQGVGATSLRPAPSQAPTPVRESDPAVPTPLNQPFDPASWCTKMDTETECKESSGPRAMKKSTVLGVTVSGESIASQAGCGECYSSNMSQVPSIATSSTIFETIFRTALEAHKERTNKDIASHPLAVQLQSCDSPNAILAILRAQVQAFDQSQSANEKLTRWLEPTVNVLYAFSGILGGGVGLTFPPAKAIFAGIGVLLQAVKDVRASQSALIDLFGCMEYFFKRLEKYIGVRPTTAMTDIIVNIMIDLLLILGMVTKEVKQGRTSGPVPKYLKKLVGRKDIEDALQRLDRLTQEEARMAAVEALTITRGIDDKVDSVDERIRSVNKKVEGIDDRVRSVDNKVGSVTQDVKESGVAIQQVINQVSNLNSNELRKDLRKWIAPPDPSVNYNTASDAHHEGTVAWCTKGSTFADWKASGSLLWVHGKRTYLVTICVLIPTNDS
ncbi:hypothetical protein EDB87DRAFT_1576225 [Lactarius vividus]|nr:hypothetical protein EDB87DRAFT_1576225 [Lactarius vividus]